MKEGETIKITGKFVVSPNDKNWVAVKNALNNKMLCLDLSETSVTSFASKSFENCKNAFKELILPETMIYGSAAFIDIRDFPEYDEKIQFFPIKFRMTSQELDSIGSRNFVDMFGRIKRAGVEFQIYYQKGNNFKKY